MSELITWNDHFAALMAYKKRYGTINISPSHCHESKMYKSLAMWVTYQRSNLYKLSEEQGHMWAFLVNGGALANMNNNNMNRFEDSSSDNVQQRISDALYNRTDQDDSRPSFVPSFGGQQEPPASTPRGRGRHKNQARQAAAPVPASALSHLQPLAPRPNDDDDGVIDVDACSDSRGDPPSTVAINGPKVGRPRKNTEDAESEVKRPPSYRGSKQPLEAVKKSKSNKNKCSGHHRQWDQMYERMVKYKETYGNCNVPVRYADDPPFGKWVSRQREMYSKGCLSSSRIKRLEGLGFLWRLGKVNPNLGRQHQYEENWNQRYKQLIQYKRVHGDFKIPMDYPDKQFRGWVHKQRSAEIRKDLRPDRKEALDRIGFWENIADYPMKNPYVQSRSSNGRRDSEQSYHSRQALHMAAQMNKKKRPQGEEAVIDIEDSPELEANPARVVPKVINLDSNHNEFDDVDAMAANYQANYQAKARAFQRLAKGGSQNSLQGGEFGQQLSMQEQMRQMQLMNQAAAMENNQLRQMQEQMQQQQAAALAAAQGPQMPFESTAAYLQRSFGTRGLNAMQNPMHGMDAMQMVNLQKQHIANLQQQQMENFQKQMELQSKMQASASSLPMQQQQKQQDRCPQNMRVSIIGSGNNKSYDEEEDEMDHEERTMDLALRMKQKAYDAKQRAYAKKHQNMAKRHKEEFAEAQAKAMEQKKYQARLRLQQKHGSMKRPLTKVGVVSPPLTDDDEPAYKRPRMVLQPDTVDLTEDLEPSTSNEEEEEEELPIKKRASNVPVPLKRVNRVLAIPSVDADLKKAYDQLSKLAAKAAEAGALKNPNKNMCRFVVATAMAPPNLADIERPRMGTKQLLSNCKRAPPMRRVPVVVPPTQPPDTTENSPEEEKKTSEKPKANLAAAPDRPMAPIPFELFSKEKKAEPTSPLPLVVTAPSKTTRKEITCFEDVFLSGMSTGPPFINNDWKRKRGWSYVMAKAS